MFFHRCIEEDAVIDINTFIAAANIVVVVQQEVILIIITIVYRSRPPTDLIVQGH